MVKNKLKEEIAPKNYGYLRVSKAQQDITNQQVAIMAYVAKQGLSLDKIVEETISSRIKLKDRELYKLIQKLNEGDTLLVYELSRLSCSISAAFEIFNIIMQKRYKNY